MKYPLKELFQLYEHLIPPKEVGLIILWLAKQIQDQEIDKHFSRRNIEQGIKEVSQLGPNGQPQTERVLRNLLNYYIEYPPHTRNRYKLTEYAIKFISLIENKLENPYQNFPLQTSFQQYANFEVDEISNLMQLESWFKQGFDTATRQTIVDHLEALKDRVNEATQELNKILHMEEVSALDAVIRFTDVFKLLGEKADEIRYTLKLGNDLEQKLKIIVNRFDKRVEDFKHPQTEQEQSEYLELRIQVDRSLEIQQEVADFFSIVDEKLNQLKEKILFASTKLNDLQEHFQYQSRFKINLKKFLQFTLRESSYGVREPQLPIEFPKKSICVERFKFSSVAYLENFLPSNNNLIESTRSLEYEQSEKLRIGLELRRQERVAKWTERSKGIIKKHDFLDFTDHFYKILDEEGDIELALEVGYEILQFVAESGRYKINIDKFLAEKILKREIVVWKTIIQQRI